MLCNFSLKNCVSSSHHWLPNDRNRNSITDYVQRHYWPIYIVSHYIITHAHMDLRFVSFTIHVPLWLWAEQVWVPWQMIRVQEPRCLKNMFCCYKFHLKFHRNIRYFVLFSILVSEACNISCCPVDNNSAPVSGFDNSFMSLLPMRRQISGYTEGPVVCQ